MRTVSPIQCLYYRGTYLSFRRSDQGALHCIVGVVDAAFVLTDAVIADAKATGLATPTESFGPENLAHEKLSHVIISDGTG